MAANMQLTFPNLERFYSVFVLLWKDLQENVESVQMLRVPQCTHFKRNLM